MHLYALSLASILPQRYQPIRAYIINVFCLLRASLYIIFRPKYNKKNVLTIYFPPVLGLGDTILLSQIVPLVRSYFSNITIQVATSTPWVCASTQNVQYISTNDYVALAKTKYLVISAFSPFSPIVKFLLRASIPQPFKIPTKSSPNDLLNPYFNRIQSCFSTPVTSRLKPRIWSSYEISQYRKAHEELIVTFKTNSLKTPVVGVSTFTKPLERRLPLSQVITLCESIKAALGDFHLVLFGSSFHDEINYYNNALHILHSTEVITHLNSTNLCGKTPRIESLLVNMLSMDYFISCDSGIGNIVQMLNLPSLIIYGSVYPNSRIFSPVLFLSQVLIGVTSSLVILRVLMNVLQI